MKYYKEICLRDGTVCVLQSPAPREEEAALHLEHMIRCAGETGYLARYPEEIHTTIEEEQAYLKKMEESDRAITVSAYIGGSLAGNARLGPVRELERYRHRGEIAISIQKQYWGLGIGSALMRVLLEKAKEAAYEQLELDVVSDNARAVKMYEQFGFAEYGLLRHALRYRDGNSADLKLMCCRLEQEEPQQVKEGNREAGQS